MESWYAVHTRPREEGVANEHLQRQGFETYWPRYIKRSSHARRVRDLAVSLFPRYLFARFDRGKNGWLAIRSTRGVLGLVSQGVEPVALSSRLIDDIRARENAAGFVVLSRQVDLKLNQRVHLASEAFKNHDLIFTEMKDRDRVTVLMALFGREFQVAVPLEQIVL